MLSLMMLIKSLRFSADFQHSADLRCCWLGWWARDWGRGWRNCTPSSIMSPPPPSGGDPDALLWFSGWGGGGEALG